MIGPGYLEAMGVEAEVGLAALRRTPGYSRYTTGAREANIDYLRAQAKRTPIITQRSRRSLHRR